MRARPTRTPRALSEEQAELAGTVRAVLDKQDDAAEAWSTLCDQVGVPAAASYCLEAAAQHRAAVTL
jgi:hypothetical protein